MRRCGGTYQRAPAISNPSRCTPSDIASTRTAGDHYSSGGTSHRSWLAAWLESSFNPSPCWLGGRNHYPSLLRVGSREWPRSVVIGRPDSCERDRPARSHLHFLFDPVELPLRLKSR